MQRKRVIVTTAAGEIFVGKMLARDFRDQCVHLSDCRQFCLVDEALSPVQFAGCLAVNGPPPPAKGQPPNAGASIPRMIVVGVHTVMECSREAVRKFAAWEAGA